MHIVLVFHLVLSDKELYVWVRCVKNQPHDLKNLMPTQIVPETGKLCLWEFLCSTVCKSKYHILFSWPLTLKLIKLKWASCQLSVSVGRHAELYSLDEGNVWNPVPLALHWQQNPTKPQWTFSSKTLDFPFNNFVQTHFLQMHVNIYIISYMFIFILTSYKRSFGVKLSEKDQSDLKSRQILDQQKNAQHTVLRAHQERRGEMD